MIIIKHKWDFRRILSVLRHRSTSMIVKVNPKRMTQSDLSGVHLV